MQIIYITHHNILNLHALSTGVSWAIVAFALVGCVGGIMHIVEWIEGVFSENRARRT